MKTYLTLRKRNKNGLIIFEKTQPSRSWTLHFFHLWYILLGFNSNTLAAINDINGAPKALDTADSGLANLSVRSNPGGQLSPELKTFADTANPNFTRSPYLRGEDFGIVIGTDNTAAAPDDDALGVQIAHGEAATQMLYGGTEIFEPVFANPNGTMVLRRYFTNESGGGITVEECGIYAPAYISLATGSSFCICRDVTGGVAVADTEILEVTYTVQITV
jgi:hypothetical protein